MFAIKTTASHSQEEYQSSDFYVTFCDTLSISYQSTIPLFIPKMMIISISL